MECGLVAPGPVGYQGDGHHPALRGRVDEGVSLEPFRGPNALWGRVGWGEEGWSGVRRGEGK